MNALDMLDALIGLLTVYLILSLIVTAASQAIAEYTGLRGKGFRDMVVSLTDEKTARAIYRHQRIKNLRAPNSARDPSYVPTPVLTDAMLDVLSDPADFGGALTPAGLERMLGRLPADSKVLQTFAQFWTESDGDVKKFRARVNRWVDDTGERARGWFKRKLSPVLIVLGVTVAVFVNADTIYMFQVLTQDRAAREVFLERAMEYVDAGYALSVDEYCKQYDLTLEKGDSGEADNAGEGDSKKQVGHDKQGGHDKVCNWFNVAKLAAPDVSAVVGWEHSPLRKADFRERPGVWGSAFLGWILTGIALSLGAPFWFNLLQKLVQIRGSLRPGEEKGKDKAKDKKATAAEAEDKADNTGQGNSDETGNSIRLDLESPVRGVVRPLGPDIAPDAKVFANVAAFEVERRGWSLMNALWCGRLAHVAYMDEAEAAECLEAWGLRLHAMYRGESKFEGLDTQAQLICGDAFRVLAFRGTEGDSFGDWVTNANFRHAHPDWLPLADDGVANNQAVSQVHAGFDRALDAVWSDIATGLRELDDEVGPQPLWITGHSLGGALAQIAAVRLKLQEAEVHGLYTYGQPRVGNQRFAALTDRLLARRYFRVVNNRDIVPMVPPPVLTWQELDVETPYAHAGKVLYFDTFGRGIFDPSDWFRTLDKLSLARTKEQLKAVLCEGVEDHDREKYVANIGKLLGHENVAAEPSPDS